RILASTKSGRTDCGQRCAAATHRNGPISPVRLLQGDETRRIGHQALAPSPPNPRRRGMPNLIVLGRDYGGIALARSPCAAPHLGTYQWTDPIPATLSGPNYHPAEQELPTRSKALGSQLAR